jgi:hypothetical protein
MCAIIFTIFCPDSGRDALQELAKKASSYATSAHARINQLRKYTLQPYDVHLRGVAGLVASVGGDEEMIAASWLHDVVEDTPATFDDLEREFGSDVMMLVKELTDVSRPGDGNRAIRKAMDREHLAAASPRAKTIKLADVIDNCSDICRHDPKFGRVYLTEMKALMDVLREGDQRLYAKAMDVITDCTVQLGAMPAAGSEIDSLTGDIFAGRRAIAGQHGIRLFTEAFAARDILEQLISFDAESLPRLHGDESSRPAVPVVGIRTNGVVTGYLTSEDLSAGAAPQIRPFDKRQVIDLETPIADVIHILTHFAFSFVTFDGAVIGLIGRQDMEKPVVRMWLFGIIILMEMLVVEQIRSKWPDGTWDSQVSEGRLDKARQLQAERERRGLKADLLDCLQFSDKLQLILQHPGFMEATGFTSIAAARRVMKDLESLRNNLAHGQDITRHDWPQIVRLARRINQLYGT